MPLYALGHHFERGLFREGAKFIGQFTIINVKLGGCTGNSAS